MNDPEPLTFLLDEDVPYDIATICRGRGHLAHTAQEIPAHADQDIKIYALDRGWVLIAHDSDYLELSGRLPIGQHVQLTGAKPFVAGYFGEQIDVLVPILRHKPDVFITVNAQGFDTRPSVSVLVAVGRQDLALDR